MTYQDARQSVLNHDDPLFDSQLIAFHKNPCDDGSEDALYMYKTNAGMIDLWYAHSCGHQQWLREIPANMLPDEGWQLLQISRNRVILYAIFPDKPPYYERQCPRHGNRITGSECNA